jgi:hypothetical protein
MFIAKHLWRENQINLCLQEMKKETKLQAAFKDLNEEMRKLRFRSMGISSFLLAFIDTKKHRLRLS